MISSTLRSTIYQSVLSFATPEGINASGKEERFGCIFGRDSFITILKLLKVVSNLKDDDILERQPLIDMCGRALRTLIALQGQVINIESGEQPGKFIHEYRKSKYERLVNRERPWYLYPDKVLKNYDSLDSTPLGLITIHKYWKITQDNEFLLQSLPAVEKGLNWIMSYGDLDDDTLLEYEFPVDRIHGGLTVQSWTDSRESLLQTDGTFPLYPIAPVEVQGYAWLALKLWADFYATSNNYPPTIDFSIKLQNHARRLKKNFNSKFMFQSEDHMFPVQALDGRKEQIQTVTGNPLLLLWASFFDGDRPESILDDKYIPDLVKRSYLPDMFDKDAGIRTMSTNAKTFNSTQNSYHNGSFWPKLNGMSHEGLSNWNYADEAQKLSEATLKPINYFGTPIELYIKTSDGNYLPYENNRGGQSCRNQAWSAAVALDLLTLNGEEVML